MGDEKRGLAGANDQWMYALALRLFLCTLIAPFSLFTFL